ncbi:signal peptide peptidase SppA [Phreatobacter aquaticus]|uniref:Signal peptide peptidase SppA n=1 Tax=Phreatobacter aquaticus TaxID=2570229 RepID=A0A4D7QL46_9HYPH|nr:signal peptide peptidase SppA [Phreatobacter aquaticus]QCK86733.1 signal peptide peptidase SppA [Phreatobacter aquaticus]
MPLDTDAVLDRRLLRRKVTFWRVVAVVFGVIGLGVAGYAAGRATGAFGVAPHIARIEVKGLITQNADLIRMIERIGQNDAVRGLVVNIDSPGGTVAGSEALFLAIRRVAATKPTVAVVDGMAASGGYIAAIAADHIVTRETSMTGSIGVIVQFPNVARLLETWGVKVEAIRSTPLKAQPSGFEPTSPEATAALREVVTDSYQWFQRLVKDRRGMTDDELRVVADGRVFSGSRARTLKLVDVIGGESEARDWLATKGIARNTAVRLYRPRATGGLPFVAQAGVAVADAVGLSSVAERLRASSIVATIERSALDGLLAVWQPPTP